MIVADFRKEKNIGFYFLDLFNACNRIGKDCQFYISMALAEAGYDFQRHWFIIDCYTFYVHCLKLILSVTAYFPFLSPVNKLYLFG